ncbi:MAG: pilus assembly protein PilM [Planctomycetota bacterium]
MARATGLDVGNRRIKIVEVEGNPPKKIRITKYAAEDIPTGIPSNDPKELGSFVSELFRESGIRRELVGTALSAGQCTFREISLPFKNDDQIAKVVKFEAEGHIHYGDIDQTIVDHFKLYETAEKCHLMILAARKRDISKRVELFERAKVDPMFLDVDVMSTFNTLSALGYHDEHGCYVVADIGEHDTKILAVQDGVLRKLRSVRMGTSALTKTEWKDGGDAAPPPSTPPPEDEDVFVMEGDASDEDFAEDYLEEEVVTEDAVLEEVVEEEAEESSGSPYAVAKRSVTALAPTAARDFSERISREIIRCLASIVDEKPLEIVYLTGGGSLIPGIAEYVQQNIGCPVAPLDILGRVEHPFSEREADEVNAGLAVALGLALKEMGFDSGGVDLRQEDLQYARKFDQIKVPLAMALFLIAVALFVAVYRTKTPLRNVKLSYANLLSVGDAHFENANGGNPYNRQVENLMRLQALWGELRNMRRDYEEQLGRSSTIPPTPSIFPYLKVFFDSLDKIKKEVPGFTVDDIQIDVLSERPHLEVSGTVVRDSDLDKIVAELRTKTNYFASVDGGSIRVEKKDREQVRAFGPLHCNLIVPFVETEN